MTRLEAKVKAVNKANTYANYLYPVLKKIFDPFVGSQILKVDGSLLAKYEKLLPKFPYNNDLHVYKNISSYSLGWIVKMCEYYEHSCVYHETEVRLGSISVNVYRGRTTNEPELYRTDYNVSEILEARQKYKEAQQIADDLKDKLHPFGEYDR